MPFLNEVKDDIPNFNHLATTTALTALKNEICHVSNLLKKLTITQKLK